MSPLKEEDTPDVIVYFERSIPHTIRDITLKGSLCLANELSLPKVTHEVK